MQTHDQVEESHSRDVSRPCCVGADPFLTDAWVVTRPPIHYDAPMLRVLLITIVLAGCSSGKTGVPPQTTVETSPATNDPGAIAPSSPPGAPVDTTPTPTSTPITQPPEPTTKPPSGGLKADGASCLDSSECASYVCEGLGCTADKPGTCAPKSRACTRDLRPYCGCDGKTFRTSGSCPGRRFSARAECP